MTVGGTRVGGLADDPALEPAEEGRGVVCCKGTRVGGEAEDPADEGARLSLGRGCVVVCDGGTGTGGVAEEPGEGGPAKPGGGGCDADGIAPESDEEPTDADAGCA